MALHPDAGKDFPPRLPTAATPYFLLGVNSAGSWVIRETTGRRAGLFRTREAAIKYARDVKSERQLHDSASASRPGPRAATLQPESLIMRLDIYGQFVVSVVTPNGGWSKGRPIAFIEEGDKWCPADLLIPNDLTDTELERYVADRFSVFAKPGREIRRLDAERRVA